jgi:hypothetical protein
MFDSEVIIDAHVYRPGQGKIPIAVKFPNDEQWDKRIRKRKVQIHRLGRGASETDVDSEEADLALYNEIRENGSPDLDGPEAVKIINAVSRCDVKSVELDGSEGIVTLVVPRATVTHRLRIPTAKEVQTLQKSAFRLIEQQYGRQEMRFNVMAGAALWDACKVQVEGYLNGVPALHKDMAIRAVIDRVDQETQMDSGEDF